MGTSTKTTKQLLNDKLFKCRMCGAHFDVPRGGRCPTCESLDFRNAHRQPKQDPAQLDLLKKE